MSDAAPDEIRLAAEIERLKVEFPQTSQTRELYREACVLLFFRFGMTPTANRLHQLVRRGSMSTPVAVLAEFWSDLREKSRVRIEHADLPEDLQGAAGELVAALWKRAASAAETSLAALRDDVEAVRLAAEASVATLQADLARTEAALEQRTTALLASQVQVSDQERELAAAAATRSALEGEIGRLQQEGRERDAALAQARVDFAAELDKVRASAELAETRLQAAEKRALLEIDRERSATARLQRELEGAQQRATLDGERAQGEIQALQKQLGDVRHHAGILEGQLGALQASHDAQNQTIEVLRQKLTTAAGRPPERRKSRRAIAGAVKSVRSSRKGAAGT
ncbi:MAG: DNA-binding protein [Burkholderia contaminans]|uniref:DNA-binding protein n=3 Tax=Burkholderiaceae TaxID=119060 RepID=A0ABD4UED5_9BURK|nr:MULTISPECIES: DNA-binding protein [Burkholderiaceae]ASW04078.1 ATPase [Paraburkholderia aromaticivorans]KVR81438.1 ATPase [Burkholderia vietnamiensis]MBR8054571.1 DNA-binding protein [Burkholderia vietnamiensis]MCA7988802.1 DNA-binding protein [Burkholderia vietnamiensis]MCA8196993.1 DNA-binding protein [Burkholderia vietnamiensis]